MSSLITDRLVEAARAFLADTTSIARRTALAKAVDDYDREQALLDPCPDCGHFHSAAYPTTSKRSRYPKHFGVARFTAGAMRTLINHGIDNTEKLRALKICDTVRWPNAGPVFRGQVLEAQKVLEAKEVVDEQ